MAGRKLTDAEVKNWPSPETGRAEVFVADAPGLVLRVTSGGEKSWSFRFRNEGRTQRITIGPYPSISLKAAKAKAGEFRAGLDKRPKVIPQSDREIARIADERARADEERVRIEAEARAAAAKAEADAAIAEAEAARATAARAIADARAHEWETFADLYLLRHAKPKKRSAGEDERMLKLHVTPRWAGRDFRTIKRSDCTRLIEDVADTGKGALANRLCPLLSKMFKFAVDRGMLDASPAVALTRPGKTVARDRVLTGDEIALLWAATDDATDDDTDNDAAFTPLMCRALRLILATGVRPGEVAGMHEGELIDFDNPARATWYIPAERMKANKPHAVPLTPLARSIISEAIGVTDELGTSRARDSGDEALPAGRRHVFTSPRGTPGAKAIDAHALAHAMARFGRLMAKPAGEGSPAWMTGRGSATWCTDQPTPHDLRRTAATGMRGLGISIADVQAVIGHARQDVLGRHYDRYDAMPEKRRALTRWAAELERITEGRVDETVVALQPSRAGAA